jgi:hypothetical protein
MWAEKKILGKFFNLFFFVLNPFQDPSPRKKTTYPKQGVEPSFPAFGFRRPEQKG